MRLHDEIEWDPEKAAANLRKHRVSFEDAARVLMDPDADRFHHEAVDEAHSEHEERTITTGCYPEDRSLILFVVWTDRSEGGRRITRIISARKAKRQERIKYEHWLFQR